MVMTCGNGTGTLTYAVVKANVARKARHMILSNIECLL